MNEWKSIDSAPVNKIIEVWGNYDPSDRTFIWSPKIVTGSRWNLFSGSENRFFTIGRIPVRVWATHWREVKPPTN